MRSIHEVGGPSAWTGSDIQDSPDWIVELADRQAHELLDALAAIEADGLDFFEVNRENFVLPTLGPLLEAFLVDEDRGVLGDRLCHPATNRQRLAERVAGFDEDVVGREFG